MPIIEWGSPSGADQSQGPTAGLAGPELLGHLEKTQPMVAASVKSIYNGDENAAGRNLQKLLPLTSLVYPDFKQQDYAVRLATRKNYQGGGKQFQELQALNTVGGHLQDLMEASDNLKNSRFPMWNRVANTFLNETGDPRVKDFNTSYAAVTNELAKAYHGGHVSDSAVRDWQNAITNADSPEQQRTVIGRLAHLLHSKIQASEEGYRNGMGKAPLPQDFSALSSRTQGAFQKIGDWSMGIKPEQGGAPTSGAPAPAGGAAPAPAGPKPGKYIYDPASRQMVPQ